MTISRAKKPLLSRDTVNGRVSYSVRPHTDSSMMFILWACSCIRFQWRKPAYCTRGLINRNCANYVFRSESYMTNFLYRWKNLWFQNMRFVDDSSRYTNPRYTTVQKFGVGKVFYVYEKSLLCSQDCMYLIRNTAKNNIYYNILQCTYMLKQMFSILIYFFLWWQSWIFSSQSSV